MAANGKYLLLKLHLTEAFHYFKLRHAQPHFVIPIWENQDNNSGYQNQKFVSFKLIHPFSIHFNILSSRKLYFNSQDIIYLFQKNLLYQLFFVWQNVLLKPLLCFLLKRFFPPNYSAVIRLSWACCLTEMYISKWIKHIARHWDILVHLLNIFILNNS